MGAHFFSRAKYVAEIWARKENLPGFPILRTNCTRKKYGKLGRLIFPVVFEPRESIGPDGTHELVMCVVSLLSRCYWKFVEPRQRH